MGSLDRYLEKRDFDSTPEPRDPGEPSTLAPRYSIQKHDATRLHFDLRLEHEGVLLSWAVTRGPTLDPHEKRLAVRTEDHPLSYLTFEGTIPEGYGAGTVMLWDVGHWEPLIEPAKGLAKGHLHFALHGRRLTGRWNLVLMKGRRKGDGGRENWLLIKEEDDAAHRPDPVEAHLTAVQTNRTLPEIAKDAAPRGFGPARRAAAPKPPAPQLATLTDDPQSALEAGARTWHEPKLDGYRALVTLGKGGARITTRNGHDWSDRFAQLLPALDELPAGRAILDGEIIAGGGLAGFGALQKAIDAGGPFTYCVFDLLHLDGKDLTKRPLRDRRAALDRLLADVPPKGLIRPVPVIEGGGDAAFEAICEAGGEGLIAKRTDAPYRPGRGRDWLKIKCVKRMEVILVGWTGSTAKGRPFGSLLTATRDGGELVYRGKVGTGFGDGLDEAVAAAMKPLERAAAPLEVPKAEARGAHWIAPRLVAEVRFAELTGDGRLRHAVFLGLREDKPAREVTIEREVSMSGDRTMVAGVGVSSGDRVIFPKPKVTKLDLARYYEAQAEKILREAADRPLSLVRLPEGLDGERFFQKHMGKGFPTGLKTVEIPESGGKTAEYMYVTDAKGLVAAAQMGTVEFHIWGSRRDRLEQPDRMVFDLDPDEGLGFAEVKRGAVEIRDRLADLGLDSWALLSGGKGIHVVVPLRRGPGWETVTLFSRTLCAHIAEDDPKRFVATMSKAKRKGKIFLDWLRNERGSTAIAPFSVRARDGGPVAVPLAWDELSRLHRANAFSMAAATKRDWSDLEVPKPQSLTEKVVAKLGAKLGG